MHGHYVDCHLTVPTLRAPRRRADGAPGRRPCARRSHARRLRGAARADLRLDARARPAPARGRDGARAARRSPPASGSASTATRRRTRRPGEVGRRRRAGARRGRRSPTEPGSGRFGSELTGRELRRAGLRGDGRGRRAACEIDAAARDLRPHPPARARCPTTSSPSGRRRPARGWSTPARWVYQPHFLGETPAVSPYWPGTAVRVEDEGPPEILRLLERFGHASSGRHRALARDARREAHGVAGHAVADLELELAGACGARARPAGTRPGASTAMSPAVGAHRPRARRAPPTRRPPRRARD